MFKKRSRPASVRDKAVDEAAEDVSSVGPSEPASRDETPEGQSIDQMLMIRKLRKGQQGIDVEKFNRGEAKRAPKPTPSDLASFGIQQTSKLGAASAAIVDEKEQLARKVLSNNFTQQTNALDVNKHMMAYIDGEMAKRKGIEEEAEEVEQDPQAELFGLADRYKVPGTRVGEEQEGNVTTSSGMLSAIPEIDLGMDNRLRNIEETERAKRELAERREAEKGKARNDDSGGSTRFFRGQQREPDIQREMAKARREAAGIEPREHRERDRAPRTETATDDVVFERFKKRMRR